jgi:hypothetical protein
MHDPRRMKRWALLFVLAGACSGEAPLTEIVVIVDTNLAVPSELDQVDVLVTFPSGTEEMATAHLEEDGAPELPLTLGLQHVSGPFEPVDVVAIGIVGGEERVRAQARTVFVPGESYVLRLHLSRDCIGVMCDEGETCVDGACVPIDIDDRPPVVPCTELADCAGVVPEPCTGVSCRAGFCVSDPIECDEGESCDPELGCRSSCVSTGAEDCGNGIDDDCDETIDCDDPECAGQTTGTCDCGTPSDALDPCGGGDDDCDELVDEDCGCGEGWQVNAIDTFGVETGQHSSLALDREGGLHVAYRADSELRYAYHPPYGFWALSDVEPARSSSRVAMATGPDGVVHAVWATADGLRYGVLTDGAWVASDLVEDGSEPAIAAGPDGAHVLYRDSAGRLAYLFGPPGGVFAGGRIEPETGSITSPSIGVGTLPGYLHATYQIGGECRYIQRRPDMLEWTSPSLVGQTQAGHNCTVHVAGDTPHVLWGQYTSARTSLTHAPFDGTGSPFAIDETVTRTGYGVDFAISADGVRHASYYDLTNEDLRYARYDPMWMTWTLEPVEVSRYHSGQDTRMVVDAQGVVHVVAYDETHNDLRYSQRAADGTWSTEPVDVVGARGRGAGLAIDARGHLHALYYDTTNNMLRYATRAPGPAWRSIAIADAPPDDGTSIAVDAGGTVHVAYHDAQGLAYTSGTLGGGFVMERAEMASTVGHAPVLAVTDDARVTVLHYDTSARDLRVSVRSAEGAWSSRMLVADAGEQPAIARGPDDSLHLFCAGSDGLSRYAYASPGGEFGEAELFDRRRNVDDWSAITVDALGVAHTLARYTSGYDPVYASRTTTGLWTPDVTVETVGYTGSHPDIAVDASATVHAVFYESSVTAVDGAGRPTAFRRGLRYASRAGGEWRPEYVDLTAAQAGEWAQIEALPDGYLFATYYWEYNFPSGATIASHDALRLARRCP